MEKQTIKKKKADSNTKQIQLTKKQYLDLIKLLYLGNWMANAQRVKPLKKYEDLENHILSFYKDFDMADFVKYDKKYKKFFPLRKLEDEKDVLKLVEEYDENNFWEELINRLTNRDFLRKNTTEEIKKMTVEERFELMDEFEEKWNQEIYEFGLENFFVTHSN